jgi:hypothetical protein
LFGNGVFRICRQFGDELYDSKIRVRNASLQKNSTLFFRIFVFQVCWWSSWLIEILEEMASLRKALPQRTYQERHQPASRERFGLLEKHKDYVLRAKDYHKKQDRIRNLREKAALRNPDEFYFRMINSKQQVCDFDSPAVDVVV